MEPADDQVQQRRVRPGSKRGGVAADRSPDDSEDTRADNGPNAECGKRDRTKRFFERVLGTLRLGDQLVNGFSGEDLAGQRSSSSAKAVWSKSVLRPYSMERRRRNVIARAKALETAKATPSHRDVPRRKSGPAHAIAWTRRVLPS